GSDVDVHRRLVQAPTGGGVVQRDGHGDGGGLVLPGPAGHRDPADVADAALGVAAVGQHHLDAGAGVDVALLADVEVDGDLGGAGGDGGGGGGRGGRAAAAAAEGVHAHRPRQEDRRHGGGEHPGLVQAAGLLPALDRRPGR